MEARDKTVHKSVLLQETIDGLELTKGDVLLDGTLGGGGHATEAAKKVGGDITIIGIDADKDALERAEEKVKATGAKFFGWNGNFRQLDLALRDAHIEEVNGIIFDFGLSSDELGQSGRGFSFKFDEPLLMTLKSHPTENDLTARDVVNNFEEENLKVIIKGFGEERFAGRIARVICEARAIKPIETTFELAYIITSAVPRMFRGGRIHPATKTFQAIRIAVNDELGAIEEGLIKGFEKLSSESRMAAISFHSLEDRIVKRFFREMEKEGRGKIITKKPITPSDAELKENPRSRSAKLRIIQKI